MIITALALGLAAGCTQFPELDHTQTDDLYNADYPALVPIEPILARIEPVGDTAQQTQQGIDSRLSALRNRADQMRGTVLSAAERRKLQTGLR